MYQNQKKKVELCTKTFGLYQVSQRFQYSQIENIKTLLSKYRFFFFSSSKVPPPIGMPCYWH